MECHKAVCMRLNLSKVFALIFLGLGLFSMIMGASVSAYSIIKFNKLKENGIKTSGVITDIVTSHSDDETYHTVFVTFMTRDGKEITEELGFYSSNMYIGKPVELYYDPANPSKIAVDNIFSRFGFLLIAGGIGLVFFIIGFVFTKKLYAFEKRKTMLISAGYSVMAEVTDISVNYKVRFNNRYPYIIHCRYSEDGREYLFESHNIWSDPSSLINSKIKVWLDRDDYSIYYVDTDANY